MPHFHAFFKGAADNPHEGQPVPVGGIHVGLNLENKSGEVRLFRRYHALVAFPGQGRRRKAEEPVQEGFNTEVGHRRSKEHGGQLAAADLFQVKGVSCFVQQLDFLAETVAVMLFQGFFQCGIINGNIRLFNHLLAVVPAGIEFHHFRVPVVHALKIPVHADGPVDGTGTDAQHLLQFLHQGEGIFGSPVHLVHKGEDRNVPHPADLEQLDGLSLDALRGVKQHDRRIRRHQHPVGILGEVLVSGSIQNVDPVAVVNKLHGGAGHGDAALFLNFHPVGRRVFVRFPGFDAARAADGAAVKQQFFGQCGFARVGMGNNGEGTPLFHLLVQQVPELRCVFGWQHRIPPSVR